MTLGIRLRKLREDRGLYIRQVADSLGVAVSTIAGYEKYDKNPNNKMLKKLADFYGVSVDYLLGQDNTINELEQDFPEGIQVLRRASKELTPKARAKMIKLMNAFLEEEDGEDEE